MYRKKSTKQGVITLVLKAHPRYLWFPFDF